MWNFIMNFIIPILILQTALFVYTNDTNNLKDTNEKLRNNTAVNDETEEIMVSSTSEIETTREMNKDNLILSGRREYDRANNHLNNSLNFSTVRYAEIDSIQISDTNENKLESIATEQLDTQQKESVIARSLFPISESFENSSSSQLPNHEDNIIKPSSKNIPSHSEGQSINVDFVRYSEYLMKSVMQSLIRSSWTLVFKPLFDLMITKKASNSIDEMKNIMNSRFDSATLRFDNITNSTNLNTSILNDSDLPSTPSSNLQPLNDDKVTTGTTVIAQSDTIVLSTTESTMLFQKTMIDDYSNSKVRKPFSSRYLKTSNGKFNERMRRKRAINFNNDYNLADRQELASYFHNDKKIRENYINYPRPSDQYNFSQTIYNSDKIHNIAEQDAYSIPTIFLKNQDDSAKESSITSEKINSDISQNIPTDINDSPLLYLIDKFGYSIFDDIDLQLSTTEMNINHKTNYSDYNLPAPRSVVRTQKRISTGKKNNLRKNVSFRRRPDSLKMRRSRTQKLTKHRKNRRGMSMQSVITKDVRSHNTNKSSKYLRIHSKPKRQNDRRDVLKRKRKVSTKRSNRKRNSRWRNSQQNRQRFSQLRQSQKSGYYSV